MGYTNMSPDNSWKRKFFCGIVVSCIIIGFIVILVLFIKEKNLNESLTSVSTPIAIPLPNLLAKNFACYAPPMAFGTACNAYNGISGSDGIAITYVATPVGSTSLQCYGLGERYFGTKTRRLAYYNIFAGGTPICWGDNAGYPSIYCKGVPYGSPFEWSYSIGRNTACLAKNFLIQTGGENETDVELPQIEYDNITLPSINNTTFGNASENTPSIIGRRISNSSLMMATTKGYSCTFAASRISMSFTECQQGCQTWYPGSTPCQRGRCCVCNVNCDGGSCIAFQSYCYCPGGVC